MSEAARASWERWTEKPLIVAATVFLVTYAWPIIDPSQPGWALTAFSVTTYLVWVIFGVDYAARVVLAEHRWRFVRANWIDLVILAIPLLRPLRPLRILLALDLLTRKSRFVRGKVVGYVGAATMLVLFVAALAVLEAERLSPEATIRSFEDALWWAGSTVATVGYGDRSPTTGEGRIVAVVLMLTGIALVGVITAALASWFVERVSMAAVSSKGLREDQAADMAAELRALREEIGDLRKRTALSGLEDASTPAAPAHDRSDTPVVK